MGARHVRSRHGVTPDVEAGRARSRPLPGAVRNHRLPGCARSEARAARAPARLGASQRGSRAKPARAWRPVLRCSLVPQITSSVIDQSSGRAAKSRLAFLYHPNPETGFLHLPFISFKAGWCVSSPPATISFKCLSCSFMTSSAVFPWSGKSHGPPNWSHFIVFIGPASFVEPTHQLPDS
jgi:hypothetical protein